jgi:opacity protein-like surface antigen
MKKILLVATSIVALSTVAGAATESHNYMGGGLGWVMANAKASSTVDKSFIMGRAGAGGLGKARNSDRARIGKIFLGRSFSRGSFNILAEATLGLDAANAKETTPPVVVVDNGRAVAVTFTSSLKRKGFLGLGVGLSGTRVRDISLYGKASLLVASFQASTSLYSPWNSGQQAPAGVALALNRLSPYSTKKICYGFGLTAGASKPLTEVISLGLDYTFEMYQKIKFKGAVPFNGNTLSYMTTVKPLYHTVMFSVAKKI